MAAKYAVVTTFSFDPSVNVVLFDDRDSAIDYIRSHSKQEYDIDIEENGWENITEYCVDPDGERAVITNHFFDRTDVTEWRLGDIYD